MTLSDLAHALSTSNHSTKFSLAHVPLEETILNPCVGLLVTNRITKEVRLIHYTILEYLEHTTDLLVTNRGALEGCLDYMEKSKTTPPSLAKPSSASGHPTSTEPFPFLDYAVTSWYTHVTKDLELNERLLRFLSNGEGVKNWAPELISRRCENSHQVHDSKRPLEQILQRPVLGSTLQDFVGQVMKCDDDQNSLVEILGILISLFAGWDKTALALLSRPWSISVRNLTNC